MRVNNEGPEAEIKRAREPLEPIASAGSTSQQSELTPRKPTSSASSTIPLFPAHTSTVIMAPQTFITSEIYDESARHIREKLERQAALIETGNKQLRGDFDNKLATVNGNLSGRLGELNTELGIVRKDLQEVKGKVTAVEASLAELRNRLKRMEAVRINATISRPYEKITPIEKLTTGIRLESPSYFPSTARDFWNLKYNPTEKNSKHYLIHNSFYNGTLLKHK